MQLKDKKALVTGGSRGLGLGLVEALVAAGAEVTVVARGAADLAAVRDRLGVATIAADITDAAAAQSIVAEAQPAVLALIAGARPPMGALQELSWADFSAVWETDVRGGLFWMQAALNTPLAPGSRVLVGSSGAALQGSPLSGGYAGAKRMLWTMADYANGVSEEKGLGLRFQVLVPRQMVGGTGVGGAGAEAYARRLGITPEAFLARFGTPMPPRRFGDHVVSLLTEPAYAEGTAFAFRGDSGITALTGSRGLSDGAREGDLARGRLDRDGLAALAGEIRPELHRYCARLTGSAFDGEDVVQDTLARAFAALEGLDEVPPLRPWLFRIAHNRAIDLLRRRSVRDTRPLDEAAGEVPDAGAPDAEEALMRQQAVSTAIARWVGLPTTQRSAVILKDVLGHSLGEIAALLGLSTDAVKAHLARGRARLRAINAAAPEPAPVRAASADAIRYASLFNAGDWDGLRALLADDVRLELAARPSRSGAADVGVYFSVYAGMTGVRVAPAIAEGREVLAVYAGGDAPSYVVELGWSGGRIGLIRDYHYTRYVIDGMEVIPTG